MSRATCKFVIYISPYLSHLVGHHQTLLLRNMGAYSYVTPRMMTATRELNDNEKRPRYVGRMVSSAPATGMAKIHKREYDIIMDGVYGESEE